MRKLTLLSVIAALCAPALAWAQDPEPQEGEQPLTEEEMIELMREIQELMGSAENLLQRASTEEDVQQVQEEIVELLALMEQSEGSQDDAIESLSELIRRAPT